MTKDLKEFIAPAYNNEMDAEMTSEAFNVIMSGNATEGQIGAYLIALQKNGINKNHVLGALKVMQEKMSTGPRACRRQKNFGPKDSRTVFLVFGLFRASIRLRWI